ncbi:MAG: hypothetical protein ABH885_04275 [Candidatus Omnitrophota bacterium]
MSVLFICLRLKTLGHLLMWDEALNILSLRNFLANARYEPFYWYYWFHPPLYMFFAKWLGPFAAGFDVRVEALSLVFSYTAFTAMYFLSKRIGGAGYALLCCFFLCFMPGAIGYASWVKRDGLAAALGYAAVFVLLEKRFFLCSVLLGFSLLAKENAVFFILAASIMVLIMAEKKSFPKLALMYSVIFIMTSWWYVFFSTMTHSFRDAYFLEGTYLSGGWTQSALYYFGKLIPDAGIPVIVLSLAGICFALYNAIVRRERPWAVPVVVCFSVYVPISFLVVSKTPWLVISGFPALAMLSGAGVLCLFHLKGKSALIKIPALALVFLTTVYAGIGFRYDKYHMATYPNGWPGAASSRALAMFLNDRMGEDDKLVITEFAYWKMPICPVFIYYWTPRSAGSAPNGWSADDFAGNILINKSSWLAVANSPDPDHNFNGLVADLAGILGEPVKVGWSYVWDTRAFVKGEDDK